MTLLLRHPVLPRVSLLLSSGNKFNDTLFMNTDFKILIVAFQLVNAFGFIAVTWMISYLLWFIVEAPVANMLAFKKK